MASDYFKIRSLIFNNNIDQASNLYDNKNAEHSLSDVDKLSIITLLNHMKPNFYLLPSEIDGSIKSILEHSMKNYYADSTVTQIGDILYFTALHYIKIELIEKANQLLQSYHEYLDFLLSNRLEIHKDAIAEELLKKSMLQSHLYWKMGNNVEAVIQLTNLSESLHPSIHNFFSINLYMLLSKYSGISGNIKKGINYAETALSYFSDFSNIELSCEVKGWLSTWYYLTWDIDAAFDEFRSIIAVEDQIHDKEVVYAAYIYLGSIYNLRGESRKSIDILEQTLDRLTHDQNPSFSALGHLYLGITYRVLENFPTSIQNLKEALAIRRSQNKEDLQNLVSMANVLFHLLLTYREIPKIKKMEEITNELNDLASLTSNVFIKIIYDECRAIVLIEKGGLANISEASDILSQIRLLPEFKTSKFITMVGLTSFIDVLLLEYKIIPTVEISTIIYEVLNDLSSTLERQKITILNTNIQMLHAKFALLNKDLSQVLEIIQSIGSKLENSKFSSNNRLMLEISKINEDLNTIVKRVEHYKSSGKSGSMEVDELRAYLKDVVKLVINFTG